MSGNHRPAVAHHGALARGLILAGLLLVLVAGWTSRSAHAAELVMFESLGCPWCERWRQEIGVAYPKTEEGRRAPLRRWAL